MMKKSYGRTDYEEAGRQGEGISGLAFGNPASIARGLEGTMSQTPRMRALEAMKAKKKRLQRSDMVAKPTPKVRV